MATLVVRATARAVGTTRVSSFDRILLYVRTARHLRLVQVVARAWYRLLPARPAVRPASAAREAPPSWVAHAWRSASLTDDGRARFIGIERPIRDRTDWDPQDAPKLWRYNLHYHDDLVARGNTARWAGLHGHLHRWVAENPPGAGTGWEPYPISLRVVNWIKWSWTSREPLDATLRDSLGTQCRMLRRRIEWHLLGNHVWANAKALMFAGAYLAGPEADGWRRYGTRLFLDQMREQVLKDGGHYERSPMYHAIMTEDVLDLVALTMAHPSLFDRTVVDALREAATRMLRWLRAMSHPDGRIAFFNDAAFDIAPPYAVLETYAAELGVSVDARAFPPVEVLASSGYFRLEVGEAVVIGDVAAVGPDYQPGHAHADTLSFECSVAGERLVVNGGTSTYDVGPQRTWERGTAAHSTVQVAGADSSEVWGGFRVARRACAWCVDVGTDGETAWMEGAHDGYTRLPGGPTHRRRWELGPSGLLVRDRLTETTLPARSRALLAPPADARSTGTGEFVITRAGGRDVRVRVTGGRAQVGETEWSPRFGERVRASCIEAEFDADVLEMRFLW